MQQRLSLRVHVHLLELAMAIGVVDLADACGPAAMEDGHVALAPQGRSHRLIHVRLEGIHVHESPISLLLPLHCEGVRMLLEKIKNMFDAVRAFRTNCQGPQQ